MLVPVSKEAEERILCSKKSKARAVLCTCKQSARQIDGLLEVCNVQWKRERNRRTCITIQRFRSLSVLPVSVFLVLAFFPRSTSISQSASLTGSEIHDSCPVRHLGRGACRGNRSRMTFVSPGRIPATRFFHGRLLLFCASGETE